jgi:hypothetical protein
MQEQSKQQSGEQSEVDFLSATAAGLNLADPEDRAIFRTKVAQQLRTTTVEAMREWVNGSMRDRESAARAVADAYIARANREAA